MSGPTPSWVGAILDRPGPWRLRGQAPILLGLLMLFDSWDSVAISYTLPSIIGQWSLSPLQSGSLVSAGFGGQFLGAILFGSVAERFGRLPVLKPLVLIMSLLGIGCALAASYDQLIIMRFLQGLCIGGALPVAISYVNEIAPTATRGRFFGTFQFLMTSGFGLAALMSAWLVPQFGWRIMFALGAIPLAILPLTHWLPESPRWLAAHGQAQKAVDALTKLGSGPVPDETQLPRIASDNSTAIPFSRLLIPANRSKSLVVAALWFLTSLVSFGLVTWIPSIYVSMFKIPVADALSYNSVVALSIFILPVILRQTIDRFGRRPPAIIGTAVGGLALLAMTGISLDARLLLVSLATIGQIGVSAGSMLLWPYTAESYETSIRSLALGTASSIARGASMLTPLLVGTILSQTGSVTLVFVTFGLSALCVATLWLLATRETAGHAMRD